MLKIRQDKQVINKAIYLALGVNLEGHKELLGLWISENEGAKFWLNVLTGMQNRGVKDILIACFDGLKGFPDAINAVFPKTQIQLCVVHMVRNSMKYVSWKDYKAIAADFKRIYKSVTEEPCLHWSSLLSAGTLNIRRSASSGVPTGTISIRFSIILKIYGGPFTRPMPLNRSIVLFVRQ